MRLFPLILFLVADQAGASCYRLYGVSGQRLYEGTVPPFDISYPGNSSAYEASRARGEYLLIDGNPCGREPAMAGGQATPGQAQAGHGPSGDAGGDRPFYGYGRDIQLGPRGGHYYINERGKRVYVDH